MNRRIASLLLLIFLVPQVLAQDIPQPTIVERATPYVLRAALSLGVGAAAVGGGLVGVPAGVVLTVGTFVAPTALDLLFGYLNNDLSFRSQNAEATYGALNSLDFENLELGNDPETLVEGKPDRKSEAILENIGGIWKILRALEQAKEACKTRYSDEYARWKASDFNQSVYFKGFRSCLLSDFSPKLDQFNSKYGKLLDQLSELLTEDHKKFVEIDGITLEDYRGPLIACALPITDLYLTYGDFQQNPMLCSEGIDGDSMSERLAMAVCSLKDSEKLSEHFNLVAGADSITFEILNHHLECLSIEAEERARYQKAIDDYPSRISKIEERYRKIFDDGFCRVTAEEVSVIAGQQEATVTAPASMGGNPKATCEQIKAEIRGIKSEEQRIRLEYTSFGRRITATDGLLDLFGTLESKLAELEDQTGILLSESRSQADRAITRLLSVRQRFAGAPEEATLISVFTEKADAANAAFGGGDGAEIPGAKVSAYLKAIAHADEGYEALRPYTDIEREGLRRQVQETLELAILDVDVTREKAVFADAKKAEAMSPGVAKAKYLAILDGSSLFGVTGVYPKARATYAHLADQRGRILELLSLLPGKFKSEGSKVEGYDKYFPQAMLDVKLGLGNLKKVADTFDKVEGEVRSKLESDPVGIIVSLVENSRPTLPKTVVAGTPTPITLTLDFVNVLATTIEIPRATAKLPIPPSYHISASNILSSTIPMEIGYSDGLLMHTNPIKPGDRLLAKIQYDGDVATSEPPVCKEERITQKEAIWDCKADYTVAYVDDYDLYLPMAGHVLEYAKDLDDYKDGFEVESGATYIVTMPAEGPWERRIRIPDPVKVTSSLNAHIAEDGVLIEAESLVTNQLPFAITPSLHIPFPYSDVSDVSLSTYKIDRGELITTIPLLPKEAKPLSFSYKVRDADVLATELLDETQTAEAKFEARHESARALVGEGRYEEAVDALLHLKSDIGNWETLQSASEQELGRMRNLQARAIGYQQKLEDMNEILKFAGSPLTEKVGQAGSLIEQANSSLASGDLQNAETLFSEVLKIGYDRSELSKYLETKELEFKERLGELDSARFVLLSLGKKIPSDELDALNSDHRNFVEALRGGDEALATDAMLSFDARYGLVKDQFALSSDDLGALKTGANGTLARLLELQTQLKGTDFRPISIGLRDRFAAWAQENGYSTPKALSNKRDSLLGKLAVQVTRCQQMVGSNGSVEALRVYAGIDPQVAEEATSFLGQIDELTGSKQRDAELQLEGVREGIRRGKLSPNAELILAEAERSYTTGSYLDALIYTEYIQREMAAPPTDPIPLFAGVAFVGLAALGLYYNRKASQERPFDRLEARIRRRSNHNL